MREFLKKLMIGTGVGFFLILAIIIIELYTHRQLPVSWTHQAISLIALGFLCGLAAWGSKVPNQPQHSRKGSSVKEALPTNVKSAPTLHYFEIKEVLQYADHPMTTAEVAQKIGVAQRTVFDELFRIWQLNEVDMVGPDQEKLGDQAWKWR